MDLIKPFIYLFLQPVILLKDHKFGYSHKKQKNSLEGSPKRALFAGELEFLKIQEPRLPQHTSNVNIECAGKSE